MACRVLGTMNETNKATMACRVLGTMNELKLFAVPSWNSQRSHHVQVVPLYCRGVLRAQ